MEVRIHDELSMGAPYYGTAGDERKGLYVGYLETMQSNQEDDLCLRVIN